MLHDPLSGINHQSGGTIEFGDGGGIDARISACPAARVRRRATNLKIESVVRIGTRRLRRRRPPGDRCAGCGSAAALGAGRTAEDVCVPQSVFTERLAHNAFIDAGISEIPAGAILRSSG